MMLRFRSDASSALILARGKARHSSSQGLFAAGPSPASKGLPSTRGEPRPYARRPARPQSHADCQTPPPGVCVMMLTGPPAGGAPSPTLGAGGVRGPRPLAYGLPTSVASFRARETKDEVPSHAVPQIQAFPGLSRPFQAFPEPECPLVLPFAPLTPGTMFFANRPGLGVHGPWSPCFPGLTPTRGPWGRDRPWIEAQRPAQGRALSRESGAPRPPPRAQLGHRPRSPACPRAALELEVTEGPEDSSAQTPAGTGAPCPVATGSS